MPTPTVIRHMATQDGFIQVVSIISVSNGFDVSVQEYTVIGCRTTLNATNVFSSESLAIAYFDVIIQNY